MNGDRIAQAVSLRGVGVGTRVSVTIEDDDVVVEAPTYSATAVIVPLDAIAAVVDLRDRRARRLPNPRLLGRSWRAAGVATQTPQNDLDRATLGLVFDRPRPLPPTHLGMWWDGADPTTGPDVAYDAVCVNAGKHTEHLLKVLARRGRPRAKTLAAAALGAKPLDDRSETESLHGGRGVALLCLGLVLATSLSLTTLTGTAMWLLMLAVALPVFATSWLRASRAAARPRQVVGANGRPLIPKR